MSFISFNCLVGFGFGVCVWEGEGGVILNCRTQRVVCVTKKEYVVINAIYFTPIFRFPLASNLYPAIAFLLRDWVVLLIIVISQGRQVNFSMITSSYKAGKNRAEMRTGSILVLIFFF